MPIPFYMPKRFYTPKVDRVGTIKRILQNAGRSRREALRELRQHRLRPSQAFIAHVHDSMGLPAWAKEEAPAGQAKKTRSPIVAAKSTLLLSKEAAVRKAIFYNRKASNKAIQEMVAGTAGSVVGPVSLTYISSTRSRMETDFPGEHFSLYGKLARSKH